MITLNVKGSKGTYELNLPNSLDEITEGYIREVTNRIKLDANYSLIGIVYKERLSSIIFASSKNKKTADIAVIPVFVKAGDNNNSFIKNLAVKEKLIIAPSDIMIGYHVAAPDNLLTINNFLSIIDGDSEIYNTCLNIKEECYFIEFKIVPNCNIHGAYEDSKSPMKNPFVTKISDEVKSNIVTDIKPTIMV